MNALRWITQNFGAIVTGLIIILLSFAIWEMGETKRALNEAQATITRIEKEAKATGEGVVELSKASRASVGREVRYQKEIRYVEALPVEAGCTQSVHIAVDLMRDHQRDTGPE